jgi:hypothetical protein
VHGTSQAGSSDAHSLSLGGKTQLALFEYCWHASSLAQASVQTPHSQRSGAGQLALQLERNCDDRATLASTPSLSFRPRTWHPVASSPTTITIASSRIVTLSMI